MKESKEKKHRSGQDTQPVDLPQTEPEIVPLPVKEYAEMMRERDELRASAQESLEGWQRERADFTNYKKRMERDQVLISQSLTAEIIKKYLVVLDDLERALKMRPSSADGAAWAEGIELVQRKLQGILQAEGLQPIPAEGAEFDPTYHQALTYEESPEHSSGQVIEVIQQGYTIGDRVIRPALVRVAS